MAFQRRTGLRLTLTFLAILGMWFAVHWSLKAQRLRADYQRLAVAVGHLPVDDPTKVYIAALPSDEKFVWRFRLYLPANYEGREIYGSGRIAADGPRQKFASHGWSSHSPSSEPTEYSMTIAILKERGQWALHTNTINSRSLTSVNSDLVAFLDQPEKLVVEVAGQNGATSFSTTEAICLLRIRGTEPVEDKDSAKPLYHGFYWYLAPKSTYHEFEQAQ